MLNDTLSQQSGNVWVLAQKVKIIRSLDGDKFLVRLLESDVGRLTILHESNLIEVSDDE